jgi:large subunit ribosomal protein LP0
MSKGDVHQRKAEYSERFSHLLDEYPRILIVQADNVGSNQMQKIRQSIRGHDSVFIMGKKTLMRKKIRTCCSSKPLLEVLLSHVRGNVGLVFTTEDLKTVRDIVMSNRVEAPAKAGAIAPCDVRVPAGNTGMGPEKTSFFQALGIATKIQKGMVEIISDIDLIKKGQKVGPSEATLLNMLKISPFTYGLVLNQIYDNGVCFEPAILDITEDHIAECIREGIRNIAAISLQTQFVTVASIPHLVADNFKKLVAISLATDYTFEASEKVRSLSKDSFQYG